MEEGTHIICLPWPTPVIRAATVTPALAVVLPVDS